MGPGLGCIQDFPAWAKILVSNKNPKEIPVRDELGGLCEQRKSGGIFPADGESRDVAEMGCSGGVPTFLWHSGGDGSKGKCCHTWACSVAGVRGKNIYKCGFYVSANWDLETS